MHDSVDGYVILRDCCWVGLLSWLAGKVKGKPHILVTFVLSQIYQQLLVSHRAMCRSRNSLVCPDIHSVVPSMSVYVFLPKWFPFTVKPIEKKHTCLSQGDGTSESANDKKQHFQCSAGSSKGQRMCKRKQSFCHTEMWQCTTRNDNPAKFLPPGASYS